MHISKLGRGKRINAVEDVLSLGQEIEVRVDEIDDKGKVSLTPVGDEPAPSGRRWRPRAGERRRDRRRSHGDDGSSASRSRRRSTPSCAGELGDLGPDTSARAEHG